MSSDGRLPLRVALPLLFVAGAGALVIETTWIRWFRMMLGATAPAVSAALVALALGQLIGALVGARVARRSPNPLRAFGLLQLFAVALAFAVEPALSFGAGLADAVLARFVVALCATVPASS